jgi:hypothetical protein
MGRAEHRRQVRELRGRPHPVRRPRETPVSRPPAIRASRRPATRVSRLPVRTRPRLRRDRIRQIRTRRAAARSHPRPAQTPIMRIRMPTRTGARIRPPIRARLRTVDRLIQITQTQFQIPQRRIPTQTPVAPDRIPVAVHLLVLAGKPAQPHLSLLSGPGQGSLLRECPLPETLVTLQLKRERGQGWP